MCICMEVYIMSKINWSKKVGSKNNDTSNYVNPVLSWSLIFGTLAVFAAIVAIIIL